MKNKKAFYFTIITLFCIIVLLLLSFQIRKEYYSEAIKTRILTTNNFIKSIERDASRAAYISGYRTMLAITSYLTYSPNVSEEPEPITNIQEVFADALFNGSLEYSLNYPEATYLFQNTTINAWQENAELLSESIGLVSNFSEINSSELNITQIDPWHVYVGILVKYNISDPVSEVKWHRNAQVYGLIPIVNFEDPLYDIEFGPNCGNKILINSYAPLINNESGSCNTTNLMFFMQSGTGSMYVPSNRAPSYLMRLKGNYSADTEGNGIESLINLNQLSSCIGISNSRSIVDFEYIQGISSVYSVAGMPEIKLSAEDVNETYYNVPSICLNS